MIKIIKGTFGYYKDGAVTPVTEKDGPISIDPAREAELIEAGVAVRVDAEIYDGFEVTPEWLKTLKLDELKDFADQLNMKYKAGIKKAELVTEILEFLDEEAKESEAIGAEDGEEAPDFDPEEAVQ